VEGAHLLRTWLKLAAFAEIITKFEQTELDSAWVETRSKAGKKNDNIGWLSHNQMYIIRESVAGTRLCQCFRG
jgi:hypothetical protein